MRRSISLIILGLLLGMGVMFAYQGRELDRLYLKVSVLQERIIELMRENTDLQINLVAERNISQIRPTVKSILVETKAPDTLTEIETIRIVKRRLESQIDKEITDVNPKEVIDLVNGWMFNFHQQQYRIRVISVVISGTIVINVNTTRVI